MMADILLRVSVEAAHSALALSRLAGYAGFGSV